MCTADGHKDSRAPLGPGAVHILGVDGMTLDVIEPLMGQGDLPCFGRILREGSWGRMPTLRPSSSAMIWTSMATGRECRYHGIPHRTYYNLWDRRIRKQVVSRLNKVGLKPLVNLARRTGLLQRRLYESDDLRCPNVWDIVGDAGGSVAVVNWYNTWPAYPVNGVMISDRIQFWRSAGLSGEGPPSDRHLYPQAMADEFQPLMMHPCEVAAEEFARYIELADGHAESLIERPLKKREAESELRFVISSDISTKRCLLHCLDHRPAVSLTATYFWAMDKVQHMGLHYVPFMEHGSSSERERRRYGNIVPAEYRFIDDVLGEVMQRMGPEDTLIAVSDHGFAFEPKRGTYGHKRALPDGVFLGWGRGLTGGRQREDITVFCVAPTVLHLLGLKQPEEMRGRSVARQEADGNAPDLRQSSGRGS